MSGMTQKRGCFSLESLALAVNLAEAYQIKILHCDPRAIAARGTHGRPAQMLA
jgi:hypothetical protein